MNYEKEAKKRINASRYLIEQSSVAWVIFNKHEWTLIPIWISDYIHYELCPEITYLFPKFNGADEWISDFIPYFAIGIWQVFHPWIQINPY